MNCFESQDSDSECEEEVVCEVEKVVHNIEDDDFRPQNLDSSEDWVQSEVAKTQWIEFAKTVGSNIQPESPVDIFNYFFDENYMKKLNHGQTTVVHENMLTSNRLTSLN